MNTSLVVRLVFLCHALLLVVVVVDSSLEKKRVKRIWYSLPVLDRYYAPVRYFAAVGTVHSRTFPLGLFNSDQGAWSTGVIVCGGALITTGIVQTACHCLAEFEIEDGIIFKYRKRSPILMNVWETAYVVYIGINEEREDVARTRGMNADNAIRTRKFAVHQNCAKLGKITQQANTHDLGWITLDKEWVSNPKIPVQGVDFAPLYTSAGLAKLWKYFFSKFPICMHLGFGRQHNGELPQRMMQGWGVVLDRIFCRNITTANIPEDEINLVFTWFCSYYFPRHHQKTGKGDSGGPIACSGYYFGVVEGSSFHEQKNEAGEWVKHNFTLATQIVNALYENSYEYRSAFIKEMEEYSVVLYAESIILHPTFNPDTVNSPRHYDHHQSTSFSSSTFPSGIMVLLLILTFQASAQS